jgi:hypothetical protein
MAATPIPALGSTAYASTFFLEYTEPISSKKTSPLGRQSVRESIDLTKLAKAPAQEMANHTNTLAEGEPLQIFRIKKSVLKSSRRKHT